MIVRHAKVEDLRQFDHLWRQYLQENAKDGDITLPSEKNLNFFRRVARYYMEAPEFGVVMMAFDKKVPVGVLLWGAFINQGIETSLGKTVNGWGTFVIPSHRGEGLSAALRNHAIQHLKLVGVQAVFGAVLPHNAPAVGSVKSLGFRELSTSVVLDLTEVEI